MTDRKLENVRVLGVGQLGVAIASFFNGYTMTSALDYNPESMKNYAVDNALQLKEFDGGIYQRIDKIINTDKKVIIDNFSSPLLFIVSQIDGKFQEAFIPALLKLFRSRGIFVGFFPIIPIGADRRKEMEKVNRIKDQIDMVDVLDSEAILTNSKNQRILDINVQYYNYIWRKIRSIAKVVENSTSLGISLHDIKMMTGLYGPIRVIVLSYPFVNLSIVERDFFDELGKIPREKIKRIYMIMEIGEEMDSDQLLLFVKKVKNRLSNVDLRQGFIHTDDEFGLIALNFGSF
jgi:hypothetical protein